MRALGEMAVEHPVAGSFSAYANDYTGPMAGFMTGWTYWITWTTICMAEVTACGMYMHFWFPEFPQWVTALILIIGLTIANLTTAKAFGEIEFWFAIIKVTTIIVMIIIGLAIITVGFANNGEATGVSNLYAHGVFPYGAKGIFSALSMVAFAFIGVELIGITAGEAANPRKVIPQATNAVFWRILIFYIGALAVILCIYPWTEIRAGESPFVMVFTKTGIAAAASIINFVVITAAASSCNSGIYTTGRMLFNLAKQGHAPKYFAKLSGQHVPARAILFSTGLMLFGVLINYFIPERAFQIITSVSTLTILFCWAMILITQIKFRKKMKAQGLEKQILFKMPLFPVANYISLALLAIVLIALFMDPSNYAALAAGAVWFIGVISMYFLMGLHKETPVKLLADVQREEVVETK